MSDPHRRVGTAAEALANALLDGMHKAGEVGGGLLQAELLEQIEGGCKTAITARRRAATRI